MLMMMTMIVIMMRMILTTGVDKTVFVHKHIKKKQSFTKTLPLCPYADAEMHIVNYMRKHEQT